ncbi:Translocon at the outer membrane of chloroplasts like [Actinidia chinensis var. chinensis]|uniref:Translocon at the outer membrane of chloroplasts like n=1 Tax=Actinidia chinensis var. chinensis TaxID=1590841 RepID=A0A2R6RDQ2_ACTCC|nr:Translocon at the outer membrane of chloroplasts like [Actinidia chinensis var. chinensis]
MAASSANLWALLGLGLAGILIVTRKLKKTVKEDFGAFVQKFQLLPPPPPPPPKAPHPLTGLTFSVSDVFDIDGFVTGFGNPDWVRTHEAASRTAFVVSALVEGGATCVGKTVVDEMAYSISGENNHYGAPTNPAAHERIPGGSSSGAAVAVAANLVDFSLGIDTDGGVRVPAGYCGVIGFRPSYGAVSHMGIIPISSSFDTVGWFAKDPNILRRVGHVLLQVPFALQRNPRNIIIADDCFQLMKIPIDRVAQVVIKSSEKLFGRQVLKHENLGDYLEFKVPSLKAFHSKKSNGEVKSSPIRPLANVMLFVKRHEFKCNHEEWISLVKPALNPTIATQIHEMLEMSDKEIETCHTIRSEMRVALNSLLKDGGVLVMPTIAGPPPKVGGKEILSDDYLSRAFSLLSLASLSGCCQVTIPLGFHDKCPISVSLIARHGADRFLLDTAQTMHASLQEQVDIVTKSKLSANAVSQETSAEIAKEKGNQAFKDKQWQKAVGFYTDAIKLNGNNATYYSNRAAAFLELGSFLQAEADSSAAINLDKKNVKAYLRRGTAREMLGYYKEAIEDFSYALVLEPTNKRAALSTDRLKKLFQ